MADFFATERDPTRNSTLIRIFHDGLIANVSTNAVLQMIAEEIQSALTNDQELRILVREMIKEAIAKMNLQEVVAEAVKAALKAENHSGSSGG